MSAHEGRFTDRVDAYTQGRPGYPSEVVDFIMWVTRTEPTGCVADLGSGTGIFTAAVLQRAARVFAVEPDLNMRLAAERSLSGSAGFESVEGTAEQTTLPDDSIDLVTIAQAFHWCDPAGTARECRRILKSGRPVVLLWNTRRESGDAFHDAYEALLRRWGTDYLEVRSAGGSLAAMRRLWPEGWGHARFSNRQTLDLAGLRNRLVSSSYTPAEDHPDRVPMLDALTELFGAHAENGTVKMLYDTEVFFGTP